MPACSDGFVSIRRALLTIACAGSHVALASTARGDPGDGPRPRVEVEAHGSFVIPVIADDGVGVGPGFGALFLYRPGPHHAVGVLGDYAALPWSSFDTRAHVFLGLAGLAWRLYAFDHGARELYVQLGSGVGFVGSAFGSPTGSPAPGFQLAAGADVYVAPAVRLSTSAAFTLTLISNTFKDDAARGASEFGGPLVNGIVALRFGVTWVEPRRSR